MRNRISKILFIQLISIMMIIIGTCNVYGVAFTPNSRCRPYGVGGQYCVEQGVAMGADGTNYAVVNMGTLPADLAYAYNHGADAWTMQSMIWANQGGLNPYGFEKNIKRNIKTFKEFFGYEYANLEKSFATNKAILLGTSEEEQELNELQVNIDMDAFIVVRQYLATRDIIDIIGKNSTRDTMRYIINQWKKNIDNGDNYINNYNDKLNELTDKFSYEDISANTAEGDQVDIEQYEINKDEWDSLDNIIQQIKDKNLNANATESDLNSVTNLLDQLLNKATEFMNELEDSYNDIKSDILEKFNITDEVLEQYASDYKTFKDNIDSEGGYNPKDVSVYPDYQLDSDGETLVDKNENDPNEVKLEREDNFYILGPYKISYVDGGQNSDFARIISATATQWTEESGTKIKESIPVTVLDKSQNETSIDVKSGELFYIKINQEDLASDNETGEKELHWITIDVTIEYLAGYSGATYTLYTDRGGATHSDDEQGNCQDFVEIKPGSPTYEQKIITLHSPEDIEPPLPPPPPPPPPPEDDDEPEPEPETPTHLTKDNTMTISGNVFEDIGTGKNNIANGYYNYDEEKDEGDTLGLSTGEKITVILRNAETGRIVNLSKYNQNDSTNTEYKNTYRANPTVTDEDGYYQFSGLDIGKQYYVEFVYNGQKYQSASYNTTINNADGDKSATHYNNYYKDIDLENESTAGARWRNTSKVKENEDERSTYNDQFATISAANECYIVEDDEDEYNSGVIDLIKEKITSVNSSADISSNIAFSQNEIYGIKIQSKYEGSEFVGTEAVTTEEYNIQKIALDKIYNYIQDNGKYPSDGTIIELYEEIYNEENWWSGYKEWLEKSYGDIKDEEWFWRIMLFIENCKISTYTTDVDEDKTAIDSDGNGVYPVYSKFVVDDENKTSPYRPAIYEGQLHINCGLNKRMEIDMSLSNDIEKIETKINGISHTYTYGQLQQELKNRQLELYREIAGNSELQESEMTDNEIWETVKDKTADFYNINILYSDVLLKDEEGKNIIDDGYENGIYSSDYLADNEYTAQPLEVYVTYRINVHNASLYMDTQASKIIDYYDEDYEFVKVEKVTEFDQKTLQEVDIEGWEEQLKYENTSNNKLSGVGGYNTNAVLLDFSNMEDQTTLTSGEDIFIYLKFKVKQQEDGDIDNTKGPIRLDEIMAKDGNGNAITDTRGEKRNLAEIYEYKTWYTVDTHIPGENQGRTTTLKEVSGIIDKDSTPGSINATNIESINSGDISALEDDAAKAPDLRLVLNMITERVMNGVIWEDERNTESDKAMIGDGIYDATSEGDKKINGVTVKLIEVKKDENTGKFIVKAQRGTDFSSGTGSTYAQRVVNDAIKFNGKEYTKTDVNMDTNVLSYEFRDYIPGYYVLQFCYGDKEYTALTNMDGGSNNLAYNGQDFKSTLYQTKFGETNEINTNNSTNNPNADDKDVIEDNELGEFRYNIKVLDEDSNRYSDAKDSWDRRTDVNAYSTTLKNENAEILDLPYSGDTSDNTKVETLMNATKMEANTGVIYVEYEYNRTLSSGLSNSNGTDASNTLNGNYTLANIDFGLVERPKSQLRLDKDVYQMRVVGANQLVLYDIKEPTNGILWLDKTIHKSAYDNLFMKLPNNYLERDGQIQVYDDTELMQGTNINIAYKIRVTNIGETDYTGEEFYYTGNKGSGEIVTTRADQVIDYVANNIGFDKTNSWMDDSGNNNWNQNWNTNDTNSLVTNGHVSDSLINELNAFNTKVVTEGLDKDLEPIMSNITDNIDLEGANTESTTSTYLVLAQTISSGNEDTQLYYENSAEIIQSTNTVGRRMAYSISGNHNPTKIDTKEIDTSNSKPAQITVSFGKAPTYIAIGVAVLVIIGAGAFIIKKKVLKK